MKRIRNTLLLSLILLVVICVLILFLTLHKQPIVSVDTNGNTVSTPMEVENVKSIGQWEFLTLSDEEIVDTVRHGLFGDNELSRIYYGTLRLGSDLGKAGDDFVRANNDSVVVTLPEITLLDNQFIDEARTRPLIEDGKWTEADRAALTRKAEKMMRKRCLTKENFQKASANARIQVTALFHAMGYKYVEVNIGK
ncbi:MAG TPA: DUF4230 domain-containing protein [Prevotella sp.]|nr:DUF4230 domain-containing protein [Prevotella sp.]